MKFIKRVKRKLSRSWEWFRVHILRRPPKLEYTYICIPNIRRVYPQLISSVIVDTQPLANNPASLVFYLRSRYCRGSRSVLEQVNWMKEGF